ncbi:MAG: MerR family transcriptional regulator [Terriglobales bacterium]
MPSSYPISAAAKLTGIPLDTLRAWERRYKAVVPKRVKRGRLYSEEQIERLVLLRRVLEQGHSIGQVAALGDRRLRELLDKSSSLSTEGSDSNTGSSPEVLLPVLRALERFDYAATDRAINRLAVAVANPRDFVHQVALPLMHTIGQRWHEGKCSIAQEHIVTRHISAVLTSFVRMYSRSNPPARILLAGPRNERHEFPLLAAAMLTAAAGLGVIYVGADLPAADIVLAARKTDADVILLSISTAPSEETMEELRHIERKVPRSTALWVGGAPALNLERATAGSRWLVLRDFGALEHQLSALGAAF